MTLVNKYARRFSRGVQDRGREYFRRGLVSVQQGNDRQMIGLVRGTEKYSVKLRMDGPVLVGWCSCPFLAQYDKPCKHLWAMLLAAERSTYLRRALNSPSTRFYLDPNLKARRRPQETPPPQDSNAPPTNNRGQSTSPPNQQPGGKSTWQRQIKKVRSELEAGQRRPPGSQSRRILYIIDLATSKERGKLVLQISHQQWHKRRGLWSKPRPLHIQTERVGMFPDATDRHILKHLLGVERDHVPAPAANGQPVTNGQAPVTNGQAPVETNNQFTLVGDFAYELLDLMDRTNRLFIRGDAKPSPLKPIHWDAGNPWIFTLRVEVDPSARNYVLSGWLKRVGEARRLSEAVFLPRGGPVIWTDQVARFEDRGAFAWVEILRKEGPMEIPAARKNELLQELVELPALPGLELPPELRYDEVTPTPQPRISVRPPRQPSYATGKLEADVVFDYIGVLIPAFDTKRGIYDAAQRRLIRRNLPVEQTALALLEELQFRTRAGYGGMTTMEIPPQHLPKAVRALAEAGWHVEAEGKVYRQAGKLQLEVRSDVDWFDLHGGVQFGKLKASLPRLLQALKRGDNSLILDDGSVGLLPEDWLNKYGLLAGLGEAQDDSLRFTRTQVGLLDALLAAQPDVSVDQAFEQARAQLRCFEGIDPVEPPTGFVGELRAYQKEGLGWLHFLQKFGFGGCLADDMGLGKTVQVLALLASRRLLRKGRKDPGPTLGVVPKSLVFNWKQEAEKFVPGLRILDHTGAGRVKDAKFFKAYDLVLTTYGTLRRDALLFKDAEFDYCILDEAQAVKNAGTESAKAVRLIQAKHRLALSGTPVENHLGELWSLFEFLNPGMLGQASLFRLNAGAGRNPDLETRTLLAKGLRPFILRRTKGQVAKDLPEKTEQTLFCDLEPAQRKLYDELRDHYRQSLLKHIDEVGIKKSKIQVLEALLRLRQAACHPGLLDAERIDEASAKLDVLVPMIMEAVEEDHKVLVFSQFTSFLAILKKKLDQEEVPYEYLDGRTRDRQARVDRFQNDPECKLFLISLKAGGLGLNLTAAEYVFLMDPWWNPAVESQAIDRAHRIGQKRNVFAYRLIARDTVEEKVVELQQSKRELADAIISADNSLITSLQRDDLELLLS